MATDNHTPHLTGAALTSAGLNAPLASLDAAIKKNNYAATAAPTTGDDTGDGYTVGSRWFDVTNDRAYVALDVTLGAAVWKQTSFPASVTQDFGITGTLTVTGAETITGTSALLTINQLTGDATTIKLRSTGDVAHGVTSLVETDTYATFAKRHATEGGVDFSGYSSATEAFILFGTHTTENATRSIAGTGPIHISGRTKSGTSVTSMSADKNIVVVSNNGSTKFILDTDGDSHQDVGTAWTNFDSHDDIAVLNTLAAHVSKLDDPLRKGFGTWLKKNRKPLERMKLVTFNRDGHHFVNMSRLTMLHTGALRQLGERLELLEKQIHGTKRLGKSNRKVGAGKSRRDSNRNLARGVV